ncbi:alcohol dehydrogenase catalytic domain-containing protein [Neomegalonema perideroedes]|uniref:alcohol dehydrogenase catalytic domain-containing protein n=1 Tax=Neomegalonema perideroedes TaxID=217219 RepID=UPI0003778915|nr:alcohol dehydrogenase catalytic domain-containing protein [Neomegalonema perideroedes]
MKAALLRAIAEPLSVETVADPACPPDGVTVEVRACGLCRSDHHTWKGAEEGLPLPHVMGHEFAGVVAEVGPDCRNFRRGDRVTAPFILGCGQCADCRAGHPTICATQDLIGFTRWGAFAERLAVPRADFNLVRLPEAVGFVEAAGMGCRVTTAWRGLTDRADLRPGEWLAVHGCGGVGLSAILLAKILEARVIAVDVSEGALAMAREMGAEQVLNASEIADVGAAVRDLTGGGAHVSLDALGATETFLNSLRSLRKLGRHVQIGMPVGRHVRVELPLLDLVYARQLTLHGMRGLGAAGFASLLDLAASGRLDLAGLVTERLPLEGLSEALARMDAGRMVGIAVVDRF